MESDSSFQKLVSFHFFPSEGRPFGWSLADKLVFSKVRKLTGLDQCLFTLSGAAPITKETLEFFLSLNIQVCEVYGMSECTGETGAVMGQAYFMLHVSFPCHVNMMEHSCFSSFLLL